MIIEIVMCWIIMTSSGDAVCFCQGEPDPRFEPPPAVEIYEPPAPVEQFRPELENVMY